MFVGVLENINVRMEAGKRGHLNAAISYIYLFKSHILIKIKNIIKSIYTFFKKTSKHDF